ncbi:MAG: peptide deformylase [Deltaproteobacteria bacterium]|nr:peptide deformylase [Deltaproteobacteria bacterium]
MPDRKVLTLWNEGTVNEEQTRILRKVSEDLPIPFDGQARKDLATLIEAFLQRDDALGLAAPQIGYNRRIVAFRNKNFDERDWSKRDKDFDVLINPRITQTRGEMETGEEGCLSCPEIKVEVARFPEIKVRAYDRAGRKISKRYEGFLARIVQHEIDHLEGKLIVDHEGTFYCPSNRLEFFEKLLRKGQ